MTGTEENTTADDPSRDVFDALLALGAVQMQYDFPPYHYWGECGNQ